MSLPHLPDNLTRLKNSTPTQRLNRTQQAHRVGNVFAQVFGFFFPVSLCETLQKTSLATLKANTRSDRQMTPSCNVKRRDKRNKQ